MLKNSGGNRMTLFKDAKTFKELCEINAQFVEGPDNMDSESKPLIPYLAALNRGGFLTMSSQPGEDHGHSKQRAFVAGLASKDVALRIERLTLCSDLYIMTTEPGHYKGCMMPVTIDVFRPHTWVGDASLDEETGIFTDVLELQEQEGCNESVMAELREAWEVQVIDLCWGRTHYLWNVLANELCVMLNPHESWGPSDDWPFPAVR
jgi:uncharacterized protein DUF6919